MKFIKIIICLLGVGCSSISEVAVVQQRPPNTKALMSALANSQIQASQMNQYISGIYGSNNSMSQILLDYQNINRELNAIAQNPWNGFFIIRNAWVN